MLKSRGGHFPYVEKEETLNNVLEGDEASYYFLFPVCQF